MGATADLFHNPAHAYTRALLSAIPVPHPAARPARIPWDPDRVDLRLPLREVAAGHLAAI